MRAVILSAGQGSRLRPLTDDRPKGMVVVAGKSIIRWQVELFRSMGIDEIAIVTGYRADAVEDLGAAVFANPDHATTNMVHSLFCASDFLAGDVLLSYGDILYSEEVLRAVMGAPDQVAVAVDLEWEPYFAERFGDPFVDAESLRMDETGAIVAIGQPDPRPADVEAQYIGLVKLSSSGVELVASLHADAVAADRPIGWGRRPAGAYMTDLLQEVVWRGGRVAAVPIERGWVEIDTPRDFEIATRLVPQLLAARRA